MVTKFGQHASAIGDFIRLVTKCVLSCTVAGVVSRIRDQGISRAYSQLEARIPSRKELQSGQASWRTLRVRAVVPPRLLHQRCYGSMQGITESEHRPLRSVGASACEVAARTSALLVELLEFRNVRIFIGTRPLGTDLPRVSHAVSAGLGVVLVESVLWPPGEYQVGFDGRVYCDRVYTGQSVAHLATAARLWQQILPRGHQVKALVIIYSEVGGRMTLPSGGPVDVVWVRPEDAVRAICRLGVNGERDLSRRALATLVAAASVQG